MDEVSQLVETNLAAVLAEVVAQPSVGAQFPPEMQSYDQQTNQIGEYIHEAREYAVAYESLVAMLEAFPFRLSGPTATKLLEVGLLMRYKTNRPEDVKFDFRGLGALPQS